MAVEMTRKLVEGAVGAVEAAAGAARHLGWYLSLRVDGAHQAGRPAVRSRPRR